MTRLLALIYDSELPPLINDLRLDRQNAANNKQYRQLRYRRWTRRFPRRFSHTPNATRTQTPAHKAAKRAEELSAPG